MVCFTFKFSFVPEFTTIPIVNEKFLHSSSLFIEVLELNLVARWQVTPIKILTISGILEPLLFRHLSPHWLPQLLSKCNTIRLPFLFFFHSFSRLPLQFSSLSSFTLRRVPGVKRPLSLLFPCLHVKRFIFMCPFI